MFLFDPEKVRVVPAHELAKYEVSEEDFLLRPWLLSRGAKLILAGATEVGKSWICLNIIRALVLGEPLFGNPEWPTRKSKVLYIESEVGITMPSRIKQVFADVDLAALDFHCLLKTEGFNLSDLTVCEWLKDYIKDHQFDAVVLDPIGDLSTVDEGNVLAVNMLLRSIDELQGRSAVIMSHHFRKPPNESFVRTFDPLDFNNVRGSSKFQGSVDTAITVARREGRISTAHADDSWALDISWAKTRHAKRKPPNGTLLFNERGDGRMIWSSVSRAEMEKAEREEREAERKSKRDGSPWSK